MDILGKTATESGAHQRHLGVIGFIPGFTEAYGGSSIDLGYSVVQTNDGGYAVAGVTYSFGAGDMDVWLIKTDASGVAQWNHTYGGPGWDGGNYLAVIQTSDGGYAIAGSTASYGAGGTDVWLIKTDAKGVAQWNQTYGGASDDRGNAVIQTSDGGYAITGYTWSYGAGFTDVWLIKTDASGVLDWSETYGGANTDFGQSVVQTSDGGYAITGYTWSYGAGGPDVWLIKTDASGVVDWSEPYGGADEDYGYSVVQTSDGGYAIAGQTWSYGAGGYDVWLVKTDADGVAQWNQTYGGNRFDWGESMVQTSDGGYAITGTTASYGAGGYEGWDAWLVKTDSYGITQWSQTFGGGEDDKGYAMVQTSDGGYAITGYTQSYDAGDPDVWLIKVGVEGESGLAWIESTANTVTLYRGRNDVYWNYVRVRIWLID